MSSSAKRGRKSKGIQGTTRIAIAILESVESVERVEIVEIVESVESVESVKSIESVESIENLKNLRKLKRHQATSQPPGNLPTGRHPARNLQATGRPPYP